jgi:hypothetical protein
LYVKSKLINKREVDILEPLNAVSNVSIDSCNIKLEFKNFNSVDITIPDDIKNDEDFNFQY